MSNYITTYEMENLFSVTDTMLTDADIKIISRSGDTLRLMYNNKAFDARIKHFNYETKEAKINVNGFDFKIKIKEPLDHLINELGFLSANKHSVKEVKSPMPGLVVNIFMEVGQEVSEGEKLLTLEAMKMENILKSPGSGTIKSIRIQKGNSVDKNQILIDFE